MKIIPKEPNPSGAYPPIQSGVSSIPEGCAVWPATLDTAVFYEYNGFVSLTFGTVEGVAVVTAAEPNTELWEEWKASQPEPGEEPETELSVWEELDKAYQEGVDSV